MPEGELPPDARLEPLRDLNGYFPFTPPESADDWAGRAEDVRRRILVSQGLWPEPIKTPLLAEVYGLKDCGDFTVEKVNFESVPDFYVTGTLYRPKDGASSHPAVLCPHGHWTDARLMDKGEQAAQAEIDSGAESLMSSARNHIQARCVQLARMGCVVFQYDMIGHSDSRQIAHRPGVREAMGGMENWGFFSPQAELRQQNMMGLQTWSSIRAVDFLLSLDDVDPNRIAVTGASGGGTQSMILGAVDSRVAVSMPAVMVSTAMQGGCTCENACYLRIGTGNVEFAGLFAPKPLGLTAADDWTKEISTKGMPELHSLYGLLNAPDNVMLSEHLEFPHNYNAVNRAAMYRWFNEHLQLGLSEDQLAEREHTLLTKDDLSVWDDEHTAPKSGDDVERELLARMTELAQRQFSQMTPRSEKTLSDFRHYFGGGWHVLLGANGLFAADDVAVESTAVGQAGQHMQVLGLLKNSQTGGANPVEILMPANWNGQVVLWLGDRGRASLYDDGGALRFEVRNFLAAGTGVVGIDLFMQGEFVANDEPVINRIVGDDAEHTYAGYTYGYNQPLFAQRTQDVLSLISYLAHHERTPAAIHLAGVEGTGAIALAARAIAGEAVSLAAVDVTGFQFGKVNTFDDADFLPGAVKYGDMAALIALNAPHVLWVTSDEGRLPTIALSSYRLSRANRAAVHVDALPIPRARAAAAGTWLLENSRE